MNRLTHGRTFGSGPWRALLGLGLLVNTHAAEPFCESFASDPVAGGRFVTLTAGTESQFRWDGPTQRLEATLDVDASPAYYLSSLLGPFTDAVDCSFSVTFRVQALDDQFSPTAAIGLLTTQHVGDGGNGLAMVLSATNGTLVASATIEPPGVAPSVGGDPVRLELGRTYQAVGRYRAAKRELSVELFDGAGFTNLVGFSLANLPAGTPLHLDRLGLQNAGARRGADPDVGSLTLTVDDLCTPADFPNLLTITPAELTVTEGHSGSRLASFTVTLSPASSQEITVDYLVSSPIALTNVDFVPPDGRLDGRLLFPPGVPSVGLTMQVRGDLVDEEDERVQITLRDPVGASLGSATATLIIADDDDPPTVSVVGSSVVEGDAGTTPLPFTLTVTGATEKPVSLRYQTQPGTATADVDYLSVSNRWVLPPERMATNLVLTTQVNVLVVGDLVNETVGERNTEDFFLVLDEAPNLRLLNSRATGLILDDDIPPFLWIDNEPAVREGLPGEPTNLVFHVRLSRPVSVEVKVGLSTVSGTATEEVDFLRLSTNLTFAAGAVRVDVPVAVLADDRVEPDEFFEVFLRDPVASIPVSISREKGRAKGWILNDDVPPRLSITNVTVTEGDVGQITNAVFAVHLDPAVSNQVTVHFATAAGSATPGLDYETVSTNLTFPPGTKIQHIVVPVLGDLLDEADEEDFYVNLSNAQGATIAQGQGRGVIRDNDPLPFLRISGTAVIEGPTGTKQVILPITLEPVSGRNVQVTYTTEDGTAKAASGDYQQVSRTVTLVAGQTVTNALVLINGDRTFETDEQFCVRLSNPVNAQIAVPRACVIITNDDDPPVLSVANVAVDEGHSGTTDAVFTLRLSAASEVPVSLIYQTRPGTATAGTDYQTLNSTPLTFRPTETPKPVIVKVNGDLVDEDNETFFLRLSNVVNATPDSLEAQGTIRNDDFAFLRIEDALSVVEGHTGTTPAPFRVTLTTPSSRDVTFEFATANGTAQAPTDYQATNGSRTIPSLSPQTTIDVLVNGDRDLETNEIFYLDLRNATGARGIQRARAQCEIEDDDTPIADPPLSLIVTEGDAGTTTNVLVTVRLDRPAPAPVSVHYQTHNGTATGGLDYQITSGDLHIPVGAQSAQFLVTVIGDNLPEPDETFEIRFSNPVNAIFRRTVVPVTILDDDPDLRLLDFRFVSGDCQPDNGAIDPLETVTVSVTLTNASHLPLGDVWLALLEDEHFRPLQGPTRFGPMPGHGPAVTRAFTFQAVGDCDQTVCARWEARDGTRPLTLLTNCITLGRKPDGTLACCVPGDLRLQATDQPDPATVGTRLVFSVAVTNVGSHPATAVAVTNRLADPLRFQQATPSQGFLTNRSGLLVWEVGRLESQAEARLTLEVTAGNAAELTELPQTVTSYFSAGSAQSEQTPADNVVPVTTRLEPPVGFSVNSVAVVEGDAGTVTNAVFKVWRWARTPAELASTVTVTLCTKDGTAVAPADYTHVCSNRTFVPGQTVLEFTVPVRGDNLAEETEWFSVVLSNPTGNLPIAGPGTGTILDDDLALEVHDTSVLEGNTGQTNFLAFEVTLSKAPDQPVSVRFDTADGTARVADRDYLSVSTNLTWNIGQSHIQTVLVPVIGDDRFETNETVFARLSQAVGAPVRRTEAVGTIRNDDLTPLVLSIDTAAVLEGGPGQFPELRLPVRLSNPATVPVRVDYYTADGSAKAGEDYQAVARTTLEFSPGTLETHAVVRVNGDALRELDEALRVVLTNAVNATLAPGQGEAIGTILNDDYLPDPVPDGHQVLAENCQPANQAIDPLEVVTLRLFLRNGDLGLAATTNLVATLRGGTTGGVRVDPLTTTATYGRIGLGQRVGQAFELQVDGPCGGTFDLVLDLTDNGLPAGVARFPMRLGTVVNGQPACCLQADLAVQALAPRESLEGFPVTLTNVVSNLGPSRAVGVRVQSRIPDAGGLDRILTPTNSTCSVAGTLITCDLPPIAPQSNATVLITVTNLPVGEHQFISVVSGVHVDPQFANNSAVARTRVVPPDHFSVSASPTWEGSNALVTVRLHPERDIQTSVTLSTADGTAMAARRDYVPLSPTNLVFLPKQTAVSVLIPTLGDDEDEPDEYFLARLSNPVGAPISVAEAQVWILDTNLPCLLIIGDLEVNVGVEGQAVAFVPVWLSSASQTNITVDFATRNGTAIGGLDFEHRTGTLTFTNGTTKQEIPLVISGNTLDEGREHFFVDLSNPRGATLCDPTGVVTITEIPRARLTVADVEVIEGHPGQTNHARFALRLDRPLPNPASVDVSTTDGTALAGLDYEPLSPTNFTFTPGQTNLTVTVPIVGDLEPEPDETFLLLLTKPQNVVLATDRATATIRDDDDECAPTPCGIVAWWSGEGDLADRITGLPTEKRGPGQVSFPPARVGTGLRFDGAANLETADSPSFALTNLTIEAWIRCDGIGPENRVILYKGANRLNVTTSYVLVIHGRAPSTVGAQGKVWGADVPGTLVLALSDGVRDHGFHSRTVVPLGQWVHVAATVGPDTVSLYLDGTLDVAYPREIVPLPNRSPVQIGGITAEGNRFSFVGIIDELSLYHRALSADELRAIYDAGAAGKCLEAPTEPALSVLQPEPVAENTPGGVVRLTVRLSEPPCRPVRVRYSTEDQTALAGSDYVAANDWLSFEPGQTEQEIVLTILDDRVSEPPAETFKLLLAEPLNAVLGNASAIVTILDNDPWLSDIPNQVIHEDAAGSVNFTIGDPDTPLEQLVVTATSWHPSLIPQAELKLAGSGTNRTLAFRPAADLFSTGPFGDAWIFVALSDGSESVGRTFKVTVLPVNDPPRFTPGPEVSVNEDAGAITLPGWATQLSPGPANERDQQLSFTLTPSAPGLFSQAPALDPSGTLRFNPAPNAFGTNTVTVVLRDTGGTERGGLDSFTRQFNLAVQAVNDPPTLDPIADRSHRANTAAQTVPLTGITTGAPNEIQSLTVSAISDNPALLEPTVNYSSPAATGTLTYQPKSGQAGTATLTVSVRDNGGVDRGGQDQVQRSFRVTVLPNQPPTVRLTAPLDGQVFRAPATVPLQAIATDPDGQIAQVEFLANGRVIGQDTTDPYQFTWAGVTAGTYDLVARATDNDGAFTNSLPVSITVWEGIVITLTSPATNTTYCPGAPIAFAATVSGDLPPGSVVEFHTNDGLLETATTAPFAVLRRQGLTAGSYRVHARLLDGSGQERARSYTHPFEVLEVCGDVAILKNYDDSQITQMEDLLRAERMLPFVRNGVDVFAQGEPTFERLLGYKLIIWAGLSRPGEGLTDADVALLRRLREAGKSLYLIGPQVISDTNRLSPAVAAQYAALANLQPVAPLQSAGLLTAHPAGYGDPIFQTTPGGFVVPPLNFNVGSVQRGALIDTNEFQVKLSGEGDPVMIVTPPVCDLDEGQARLATQTFGVEESTASQNLFKNTSLWLLRGWYCENLELLLTATEGPATGRVGEVLVYEYTVDHSGACGAAGVTLVEELPPGWHVRDVELANGSWEQVGPWLFVNLGCLDEAVRLTIRLHLMPTQPGTFVHGMRLRAEAEPFNPDKHLTAVQTVVEGTDLTPHLEWRRVGQGDPSFWLLGAAGMEYVIQESTDLRTWQDTQTVTGPETRISVEVGHRPGGGPRYFRARWP
ncbi:MAG: hypothetical protein HS113_20620 [Verrucomicrobiales bacterium]|nr:hypothetical protein [Verrucomicrobiales bacterium]